MRSTNFDNNLHMFIILLPRSSSTPQNSLRGHSWENRPDSRIFFVPIFVLLSGQSTSRKEQKIAGKQLRWWPKPPAEAQNTISREYEHYKNAIKYVRDSGKSKKRRKVREK